MCRLEEAALQALKVEDVDVSLVLVTGRDVKMTHKLRQPVSMDVTVTIGGGSSSWLYESDWAGYAIGQTTLGSQHDTDDHTTESDVTASQ